MRPDSTAILANYSKKIARHLPRGYGVEINLCAKLGSPVLVIIDNDALVDMGAIDLNQPVDVIVELIENQIGVKR